MWTDPWWFIYQLGVQIWFWSSAAWPLTFLYLSFSPLFPSSFCRTDTIAFSKLNKPPPPAPPPSLLNPPSNGLEVNKPTGDLNRGFTVLRNSLGISRKEQNHSLYSIFCLFHKDMLTMTTNNSALQHCCDINSNGFNIIPTLQCCCAKYRRCESSRVTSP